MSNIPDKVGEETTLNNLVTVYSKNRGAKAVMASLWLVNDQSTSQLMQHFYSNLARGTTQASITKAEALRKAQLSLLAGDTTTTGNVNRGIAAESRPSVSA